MRTHNFWQRIHVHIWFQYTCWLCPHTYKKGVCELGVTFTNNPKFSRHREITTAKATQLLKSIRQTFPKITKTDFHTLQHINMAHTRVGPLSHSTADQNLLDRVQRAATKLIYGLRQSQCTNRMKKISTCIPWMSEDCEVTSFCSTVSSNPVGLHRYSFPQRPTTS